MNLDMRLKQLQNYPLITYLFRWTALCTAIGLLVGSASALFLYSLDWATSWRESHLWIITLLPLGGLAIGLAYYYWGDSVVRGNNLLIDQVHNPRKIIPFKMAPLVLLGTIITHFFGGSAGREGTAVQMGGAIADQFSRWFKLKKNDRKIVLILGISAGFASVFGTPLAGALFALEVLVVGRMRYEALVPSFLVAVVANYACDAWGAHHISYPIGAVPPMTIPNLCWAVVMGVACGLVAMSFSKATSFVTRGAARLVKYAPFRPFFGGVVIAVAVWMLGTTKYIGLGMPTIVDSFSVDLPASDFLLKLLFTAFTLGVGFKGGEVTPLFFIGATLGNALSWAIPLPMALLAGMGFVAVFSGATNTPIACTMMGIELFGAESGVYVALACVIAYLFSGHTGIYSAQIIGSPKHHKYAREKGKKLSELI